MKKETQGQMNQKGRGTLRIVYELAERGYVAELTELKIQPSDFFRENTYKDSTGRRLPRYDVTKKGCEFIAHKLTGIMSTAELREFWPHWDAAMKEMGLPDWTREFGRTAVELVIEKKRQKQDCIST